MPDLSNDWPLKEDRPFKLARIYQLRSIWNGGLCTEGVKQLLLHELSYRSSRTLFPYTTLFRSDRKSVV